jgi:hypothetical protein
LEQQSLTPAEIETLELNFLTYLFQVGSQYKPFDLNKCDFRDKDLSDVM